MTPTEAQRERTAALTDGRVLLERNPEAGVARITLNCPERRNSYDAAMRGQLAALLDDAAGDDDVKVVLLRGAGGYFSAGADMRNAYAWYGEAPARNEAGTSTNGAATSNGGASNGARQRRPSQRRRLTVDRRSFGFYHEFLGFPKATVAEVRGLALGGGFELALMADIAVVGRDAKLGMPATRFLGPALGSLHMFFHRLGPVLARRLLLTGDTLPGADLAHLGIFTEVVDDADVARRAEWWARKVSRMPADGLVMAKEAFRLVEQLQAYQGEEVLSYLFHAYGTNLSFEQGEFNFVRTRAQHGVKRAFELRDEHFEVPEP
ncbi:enoyl-CoA hydratase/isomerase family protein [Frankia sp. AgB1.9]|nr:enoyl-CoA hydratase/isomerase family protein [Frankia sp. AgW1.1]MBL7551614.1 enoyl-CoA hydratase/isomerase family protein [Frankia sp. AgB1.9]MBL7624219.1 enoyl-CoA hydratase/isomerase family protein [Frankia sp. AgB1.8]